MRQSSSLWRSWLGTILTWLRKLFRIISTFTLHPFFDQFIMFVVVVNTGTLVALTFESVNVRGGRSWSYGDQGVGGGGTRGGRGKGPGGGSFIDVRVQVC